MKEIELKPCPFCGGEAVLKVESISFCEGTFPKKYELRVLTVIKCPKCRLAGEEFNVYIDIDAKTAQTEKSIYETEQVKIMAKRWNRRADNAD
jgi:hypothetical protein